MSCCGWGVCVSVGNERGDRLAAACNSYICVHFHPTDPTPIHTHTHLENGEEEKIRVVKPAEVLGLAQEPVHLHLGALPLVGLERVDGHVQGRGARPDHGHGLAPQRLPIVHLLYDGRSVDSGWMCGVD